MKWIPFVYRFCNHSECKVMVMMAVAMVIVAVVVTVVPVITIMLIGVWLASNHAQSSDTPEKALYVCVYVCPFVCVCVCLCVLENINGC